MTEGISLRQVMYFVQREDNLKLFMSSQRFILKRKELSYNVTYTVELDLTIAKDLLKIAIKSGLSFNRQKY